MIPEQAAPEFLEDFEIAWGVYDCQDKCWVGNDKGPLLYSHLLARAAATLVNERMESHSRFRAMVWPGGPVRYRDEVRFRISNEVAFERIEGRAPTNQ